MNKKRILIIISIILVLAIVIVAIVLSNTKKEEKDNLYQAQVETDNSLSQEELNKIKTFLEEEENNTFLFSEYTTPSEIDLNMVLYNGTPNIEASEDELNVFCEANNIQEGREDIGKLACYPREEIEKLFKEKTGEEVGDIDSKLNNWTYLPEYDRYYKIVSNVAYTKVECLEGTKEENIYTVKVNLLNRSKLSQLTLKKQGDSYLFVANKSIDTNEKKMENYELVIAGLTEDKVQKIPDVEDFKVALKNYIYQQGFTKSDTAKLISTSEQGNIVQYVFQLIEDNIRERELIIAHINVVTGKYNFAYQK